MTDKYKCHRCREWKDQEMFISKSQRKLCNDCSAWRHRK